MNKALEEYCAAAIRTAAPGSNWDTVVLGLIGEVGEVADLIKKARFHGKRLDTERLAEELGDVMWYFALGVSLLPEHVRQSALVLSELEMTTLATLVMMTEAAALVYGNTRDTVWTYAVASQLRLISAGVRLIAQEEAGRFFEAILRMNTAKLMARYPEGFVALTT